MGIKEKIKMTETDNENRGLQDAFGDRGTNVNMINYGHPHGERILDEALDALRESETGALFVKILLTMKTPVHIMKGTGESGFSAELGAIYLQVPGKISSVTGDVVINLAKAIREAEHDFEGVKAPDPMKNVIEYAGFMHSRNVDSIYYVFKIIKELTNSLLFPVLMGSLTNLGLENMYKAFLEGKKKEELYDYYSDAYEAREGL